MIEGQIDSPMPRRLSRTNEIRAFWRKIGNSIAAPAGGGRGSLDRSCSRPTSARIRRSLLAGGHHGPGDLHSHAADAGQLGQWAPWHRRTRRAIDRDEVMQIPQSRVESLLSAALANRRGDFLHLSRDAFTFAARDSSPNPDRRALWI